MDVWQSVFGGYGEPVGDRGERFANGRWVGRGGLGLVSSMCQAAAKAIQIRPLDQSEGADPVHFAEDRVCQQTRFAACAP